MIWMMTENEQTKKAEKKQRQQFEQNRTKIISEISYRNQSHVLEHKLKDTIKYKIEAAFPNPLPNVLDERTLKDLLVKKKKEIVKEFLIDLIDKRQELEISKFQDIDVKIDIKAAYMEITQDKINKSKKYEIKRNEDNEDVKKEIENNDMGNLVFLKNLRKLYININKINE